MHGQLQQMAVQSRIPEINTYADIVRIFNLTFNSETTSLICRFKLRYHYQDYNPTDKLVESFKAPQSHKWKHAS